MNLRSFFMLGAVAILLTACGSDHHITYSGHEESTEGVPGFVNGKKVSPNVKLGQSYDVDGDTYVPHFQPDYVEEGMASWYGPGFHGGKTANGESFDTHSFTAAHRTLPLPSIVKVTLLSTGRAVYVRINDRGPYARKRIIDLSYGAAKEIGLVAKGTGKVRVEYDLAASQRFADLLAQGRSPDSIDVAEEVLPYTHQAPQYAAASTAPVEAVAATSGGRADASLADHLNPVTIANASEVPAPQGSGNAIEVADLSAPTGAAQVAVDGNVAVQARGDPPINSPPPPPQATAPPIIPTPVARAPMPVAGDVYVQLGTFSQRENALRMQARVARVGAAAIVPKQSGSAQWYRVRMGPYASSQAASISVQLRQIGLTDTALVKQ